MKKILIIHPALVDGGAERVLIDYLKILGSFDKKYQTDLIFLENRQNKHIEEIPKNIDIKFILSDIESEFYIYSSLNLANGYYFSSWFNGIKRRINERLFTIINANNYDIIIDFHRNSSSFNNFINYYDLAPRIKVIYWLHSEFYVNSWLSDKPYYTHILSKYTHFIAINDQMQESCHQALTELNLANKPIKLIYNPIDIDNIQQKSEQIDAHDRELLNQEFILQVSRLDEIKNHHQMIEIYAQLKQMGITEKLYIIGGGEITQKALQEQINHLGLQEDCLLLGERLNPYPFMKRAKLFIHTSKGEGFGLVLAESMVCGTPVICYDCPTGPKTILDNGKYGVLVPLGDKATFIQQTYSLIKNNELRQSYIEKLPESIERFCFKTITKQLENYLDTL